ncbi:MAG: glycoside hydrolase family 2 protein, partial [bacterium]|nr:glycoside hydrolase family 2 protein [bacterium]
ERTDYNNPACGDAHLWDVWHGRKPFEWYRSCEHRFNSEFGFQSFPEPAVVHSYTKPDERNIASHVMEWHQRSKIGNTVILQYMLSWFQLPTSFEMLLWSSQILHGMAMKYAVEHWRRSIPRGMGTLYWQINDCWPVASWASIDYAGNWKALHYMARGFYAPLLISGVEDLRTGTVEVHVTSDRVQPTAGVVHWTLTDTDGVKSANGSLDCEIGACANQKVKTLQLADTLAEYSERRVLLWLELEVAGAIVSHNLVYFSRPKHLELRNPEFTTEIQDDGDGTFTVTIDAKYPALWVWAELPGVKATYSDRFFHLCPGKPSVITITPQAETTLPEVEQAVRLYSLVDTWK